MTAEELKEALGTLGWKQSELARRVGVGDTTVSRWIGGDPSVPEPVAAYLGLALEIDRMHRQYVQPIKPTKVGAAVGPGRAQRRVRELRNAQASGELGEEDKST